MLDYYRRWWYEFSRCSTVGIRGKSLNLANITDYNNLKDGIRKEWLMITGVNWENIEVSLFFQDYQLRYLFL